MEFMDLRASLVHCVTYVKYDVCLFFFLLIPALIVAAIRKQNKAYVPQYAVYFRSSPRKNNGYLKTFWNWDMMFTCTKTGYSNVLIEELVRKRVIFCPGAGLTIRRILIHNSS